MASREMLIIISVLATTLIGLIVATDHTIGGPSGWTVGTSLRTWAAGQTFAVGDNLVFSYPAAFHDVVEVTKPEFDSCQTVKPLITFANGNSIVPLTTPGKRYFICGMPGHCSQGMKLEVNVVPTAATAAPTAPLPNTVPSLNAPSPSSVLPIQPLLPLNPVPVLSPSSSSSSSSSSTPLPSSSLPLIPALTPALSPAAAAGTSLPLFPVSQGSSSSTSTKTVGTFPSSTAGPTSDLAGAGATPADSSSAAAKTLVLGFGFMVAMMLHLF